jgi:hypothetical protein
MRRQLVGLFLAPILAMFGAGADPNPLRVEIERAIWSRQATQMRIEWQDGKRQVIDIFDCWNDRSDLTAVPLENARRVWVRNFNPADCAAMGILRPSFILKAKPELFWREVWKASQPSQTSR